MTKVRCCAERSDAAIYNIDRAGLLAAHGGVSGGQVPRSACARNEVDGYQETGENREFHFSNLKQKPGSV